MDESESRIKAVLEEYDLEVESRMQEMQSTNHRLRQALRDAFRVQMMKLPRSIRKMDLDEFCGAYGADINAVINAEEMKARGRAMKGRGYPAPGAAAQRKKKSRREAPDNVPSPATVASPISLAGLDGLDPDEQMRKIQAMQEKITAMMNTLKQVRV